MTVRILPRHCWTKKPIGDIFNLRTPVPYVFFGYTRKTYKGTRSSPGPEPDTQRCMEEMNYFLYGDIKKGPDIRYNFMLGPDGNVYEGRGWKKIPRLPLQYFKFNLCSLYIAFIGDFSETPPSEKLFELRHEFLKYGVENNFIMKKFTLYSLSDSIDSTFQRLLY